METRNNPIAPSAAGSTPAVDPTVVTPEAVIEQLRGLRQLIPVVVPIPTALALGRGRMPHVDTDFSNATINAVTISPALEGALGREAIEVRRYAEETIRWNLVEEEARSLLQAIVAANTERRHRVGLTALQTYSIARQLVRQPENANLKPHVQQMARLNKFGRTHRKQVQPVPPTAPVPTAPQQKTTQ